jgi:hypothetical protein
MKLLAIAAAALVFTSSTAFAWTDGRGHWHEGPQLYGPIYPGVAQFPNGVPYPQGPGYFYGPPPPPPGCCYGGPAYYTPSDAQVIAGTIMGIAGMFARGRGW